MGGSPDPAHVADSRSPNPLHVQATALTLTSDGSAPSSQGSRKRIPAGQILSRRANVARYASFDTYRGEVSAEISGRNSCLSRINTGKLVFGGGEL